MENVSHKWWKEEGGANVSSFYFSDVPSDFGEKEICGVFEKNGKVVNVLILIMWDGKWMRIGFARFLDVTNPEVFGIQLNNITVGAKKIHVNTLILRGKQQARMN